MSKGDSARTHEEMARQELIQRIQLRDNALVIFLGTVGALLGFASGTKVGNEFLMVIPYLAFGAVHLIEHHNMMIGLLGNYLVKELEPFYMEIDEFAPQWDGSRSLSGKEKKPPFFMKRKFGHWVLVGIPCLLSLIINIQYFWDLTTLLTLVWWLGLFLSVINVAYIGMADEFRSRLYSSYPENKPSD